MYNHKEIEKKWQDYWDKNKTYKVENDFSKPKWYSLDMFPYPSGAGLHVGHPEGYTANDIISRYKTMQGFNVLHPMGWDAFGLPAENYAIKTGTHPRITTDQNIQTFKSQIRKLGFSYDWDREIDTTDPKYYKWTQWIFLKLFEHGLAYEQDLPINYCPSCKTGLANEEVLNDFTCERCGTKVEKRKIRQWVLAITKYAERLLADVDKLDWPEGIKDMQRNWIGKSEGLNITYPIVEIDEEITCYTTRPDTNFGMTFVTLAPEHKLVEKYIDSFPNKDEVKKYVEEVKHKSEMDRVIGDRKKTGVFTGFHVLSKLNGEKVPLYVGDFVLAHVGTGALVGVPGHDVRDFEFAQAMGIEIKRVVVASDGDKSEITKVEQVQESEGIMVNSEFLNGLDIMEAKEKIMDYMEEKGYGKRVVNYKLRDWLYSRQRYWGEPIPLIHLENTDIDKLVSFNFYHEINVDMVVNGKKTIETRAMNPEEPERYFGKVKVGAAVIFADKVKNKRYLVKIKEIFSWRNLDSLFLDKERLKKIFPQCNCDTLTIEELKSLYTLTPDYLERIEKNGLIGFSVEYISGIYDGLYGKIICDYNLPLKLPEVENYEPAGDGNSPLMKVESFVNVSIANNLNGKRETNTMPQWGGSCWYYLRFMDPTNPENLVDRDVEKYWGQVDSYVGGAEHAVLHLLYARFWHKFLFDIGVVSHDEPFYRLRNQGLILAHAFERKNGGLVAVDLVEEKDGKYYEIATQEEVNKIISKMSKSLKNVINPDEIVEEYGADSLRLYEMYMAEFKDSAPWDSKGIVGVRRFLEKS
ncbi:MAG: leucine--tRNA ligase, partial [Candidatus Gracilibacteria bacterium]|nr:leucine--tRNA ligase [Candidatus Gracilibacteria bacterium]